MRRTVRDLGILVLAAAGTLGALAIYDRSQHAAATPSVPATAAPAASAGTPAAPPAAQPAAVDASAEAQAAARATLGPDGEVLAYGDFPKAGGRQYLAAQRMPTTAATPAGGEGETAAEVIRVSILVPGNGSWKEAFRADEHLKNRRGYLEGAPAEPVSAWHLVYSKTPESGFRLEFTPVGLPSGKKPATVSVAWNAGRGEYDAVKASGKGFRETSATPGNVPVPVKP